MITEEDQCRALTLVLDASIYGGVLNIERIDLNDRHTMLECQEYAYLSPSLSR